MADQVFRTKCMCGCGDGFECEVIKGRIQVSFFRDDAGAKANIFKERADYVAGKNLLREIMMERSTFLAFLAFLESADLAEDACGGANTSHLAPTHLLDDIYAVWLQGSLPVKLAFGNKYRSMFRLSLTSMDRDVLVVQMHNWLKKEAVHAIPEGVSPHVDRLAGTSAPTKKVPSKDEAKNIAATAFQSVKAAAKAAADALHKESDPEGYQKEQELYHDDEPERLKPVILDTEDILAGDSLDDDIPDDDSDEIPDDSDDIIDDAIAGGDLD